MHKQKAKEAYFRYSEMIKYNALDGKIGDEDILKLSHKKEDGQY